MADRPFIDPKVKPDERSLQTALGAASVFYRQTLELASAFPREWAFSKGSGWVLKINDNKKALLYLIPLDGGLRISLTLRPNERTTLMADNDLSRMREQINTAKKYSEGYALVFDIRREQEFQTFAAFIQKLIALRG